ncbi:hypothetical protein, partial [Duodenibacillus massiliensis]|uniref:hypothetical protein n=1 Tax=Duodenibacillus massiliensis TaxID=1852381 RepID=UPI00307CA5F5
MAKRRVTGERRLICRVAGYCSPKEHVYSEQTKRKTALSLNQRLSSALFFERGEVNNPPSEDGGFIVTASHG